MPDRKIQILSLLQPGDILNSDTQPHWYEFWLKIFYDAVHAYQKRKWGPRSRSRDIHTMLYLGDGKFLSVTIPTAVICDLKVSKHSKYRICRYTDPEWRFLPEEMNIIRDAAKELVGTPYDLLQNVDILLKQLFPDFIPVTRRILDMHKKWKVCSVGAHLCLLKWYYSVPKDPDGNRPYKRPLGDQYAEVTCPADFANHDTFKIIAENL